MPTARKKHPVKRSIRKAQRGRQVTSSRARAQPAGRGRAEPGARGGGRFFRIEVAPGHRFIAFRYHDVGKKGGVERIAGSTPGPHLGHCGVADRQGSGACRARPARAGHGGCP